MGNVDLWPSTCHSLRSFSERSVRIDYMVKNLSSSSPPPSFDSIFGKFNNDCVMRQARSIYLIEPRPTDEEISQALNKAWHQSNGPNPVPINISSEFFFDSSYLTSKK